MVRENDLLILEKLDTLETKVDKISDTIHGNSHDGLKTAQGKLKVQVKYMWALGSAAWLAILHDYIWRG